MNVEERYRSNYIRPPALHCKMESTRLPCIGRNRMDPPQTRREKKKDPREKAKGKTVYSSKHVRIAKEQRAKK